MQPTGSEFEILKRFVLAAIKDRPRSAAKTSVRLAAELGQVKQLVHKAVHDLRSEGYEIASCDLGYYWATTASDLAETDAMLSGKIAAMQKTQRAVRSAIRRLLNQTYHEQLSIFGEELRHG
jgi:biotin operon repressor